MHVLCVPWNFEGAIRSFTFVSCDNNDFRSIPMLVHVEDCWCMKVPRAIIHILFVKAVTMIDFRSIPMFVHVEACDCLKVPRTIIHHGNKFCQNYKGMIIASANPMISDVLQHNM